MKRVTVRSYMSSANLGPGFDVMAVALNAFHDTLRIELVGEGFTRINIRVSGRYGEKIPSGEGNAVIGPIMRILEETGEKLQLEVVLEKGVPPGKGLGSSGASSAAAAKAMNELLGGVFSDDDLIYIAGEGERIASGEPHYDNVSASLLGGFVMVSPGERVSAKKISSGEGFEFLIVIPEIPTPEKKTGIARSVLPSQISLKDHVRNSSNLAKLVYGIAIGDPKLVGEAMEDHIIEAARASAGLIPLYTDVKKRARDLGAYGVAVSGAGPSMLILASKEMHKIICEEIARLYVEKGYRVTITSAEPAPHAHIIT
jgi:homoserine kinase